MGFSRYNGCGNTFFMTRYREGFDYSEVAIKVCNRSKCLTDGLIVVKTDPLEMVVYNRDGSQSPMCGNGIRCFALYCLNENIIPSDVKIFDVMTGAGVMKVEIISTEPFLCRINLGKPIFTSSALGLADMGPFINRRLMVGAQEVDIHAIFMGTIHTVIFVPEAASMVGNPLGEAICNHPIFTQKTNVNFVQVKSESELIIRTYERGVGWTKACGTGCAASYVIAKLFGHILGEVKVHLEQGDLLFTGDDEIFMTGSAQCEMVNGVGEI